MSFLYCRTVNALISTIISINNPIVLLRAFANEMYDRFHSIAYRLPYFFYVPIFKSYRIAFRTASFCSADEFRQTCVIFGHYARARSIIHIRNSCHKLRYKRVPNLERSIYPVYINPCFSHFFTWLYALCFPWISIFSLLILSGF